MQVTTTSPLFAATLRPDRSLRMAGGWLALALAGIVGAPFLVAMPDFVLPGLVAFALAAAGLFGLGLRQSRHKRTSQQVTLWADQLELQRFEPGRVRLRLKRDQFERTTGIFLVHGEGEIELGAFLSNADKSSFAKAFGGALRQARRAA
jgi:uncharacterized membrane protein